MVGPRLANAVGTGDPTIARLGGDEFGILLADVDGAADALDDGRTMCARLEEPFALDSFTFDLRASAGLAVYPEHGTSVDELIRHADVAMYVAKARRSGIEIYDDSANPHNRRRLTLLNSLRPAIADHQLRLSFQPKVSLTTGGVTGAEALVRWHHPGLGRVMPDEFIGLAEHSGLIRPMTDHLLRELLAQVRQWMDADLAVPVSLNISARSLLDPALPDSIAAGLRASDVPASLLVLELTETALMADPANALAVLMRLSDMGLRLSVDDFGTGYSSLSYLKTLPVSEVKIDKSFVTHLATDPSDQVIVHSTIELAANLGMTAVAEGVETIEAWQTLAAMGCATAQGYLLGRPEPAEEMTAVLHRDRAAPLMGRLVGLAGPGLSAGP
jgi:predicted signal transduction protein with EAL and GGDEF domain